MKHKLFLWLLAVLISIGGYSQDLQTLNEDFESAEFPPEGWTKEGYIYRSNSYGSVSGDYAVYIYTSSYSTPGSLTTCKLLPQTGESFKVQVQTMTYSSSTIESLDEKIVIMVSKDNKENWDTTWYDIDPEDLYYYYDNDGDYMFKELTLDLADYVGEEIFIKVSVALKDDGVQSSGSLYFTFDDFTGVSYQEDPCKTFKGYLYPIAITDNSVKLGWTDPKYNGNYKINYKLASTESWEDSYVLDVTKDDSVYTAEVTGLNPNTAYTFRIATACAGDPTLEPYYTSKVDTVTTVRDAWTVSDIPNTTHFDGNPADDAWKVYRTSMYYSSETYYMVYPLIQLNTTYSTYGYNSNGSMYVYNGYYKTNDTLAIVSPTLPEDIQKYRVRFWAKAYSSSNGALQFGYTTDLSDPDAFVLVDSVTASSNSQVWKLYDFDMEVKDFTATNARFVIRHDSKTNYSGWYVDEIVTMLSPLCKGPVYNSLAVDTIINDVAGPVATISWEDDHENTTSWVVRYEDLYGTAGVEEDFVNAKKYELSMESGHIYKVSVFASCGTEVSLDSCTPIIVAAPSDFVIDEFPYINDFEDESKVTEVSLANQGPNTFIVGEGEFKPEDGQYEGHALYLTSVASDDFIAKPGFTKTDTYSQYHYAMAAFGVKFGDNEEYVLSFDIKLPQLTTYGNYDYYGTARLYLIDADVPMNADSIIANGYNVTAANKLQTNSGLLWNYNDWANITLSLFNVKNTEKKIVLLWENGNYNAYGQYVAIDNLSITEPECIKPQDVHYVSQDENGVKIEWEDLAEAPSFEITYAEYDPYGSDNITDTTVYVATSTTTSITLSGNLVGGRYYYAVVSGACEEKSTPSDTMYFFIPCATTISSIPYEITNADFGMQPYNGGYPCLMGLGKSYYGYQTGRLGYTTLYNSETQAYDDTLYYYQIDNYTYIVLPKFAEGIDVSSLKVQFDSIYFYEANTDLEFGFMTNPMDTATYEKQSVYTSTTYGYDDAAIYLAGVTGSVTDKYPVIRVVDPTGAYPYVRLSSLKIDVMSDCEKPQGLEVIGTTANTATIAWTAAKAQTSFKVYYKDVTSSDYQTVDATVVDGSKATYTLANLQPGTKYSVYIEAQCGNQTYQTNERSFFTECGPTMPPYALDIKNYVTSTYTNNTYVTTRPCWTMSGYMYASPSYGYLYLYRDHINDAVSGKQYIATPEIQTDIKECVLKLDAKTYATHVVLGPNNDTIEAAALDSLQIGVMTDPSDFTTFEPIDTVALPLTNGNFTPVLLNTYDGNGKYIAVAPLDTFYGYYIYIYEIVVDKLHPCAAPLSPAVLGSTDTSITLTWVPMRPTDTEFNVHYKPISGPGYTAGADYQTVSNVSLNSDGQYTLGGLAYNTVYRIYITRPCDEDAPKSDSVEVSTFTIKNKALPLDEDFTGEDLWYKATAHPVNTWRIGQLNGLKKEDGSANDTTYLYYSQAAGDPTYNPEFAGTALAVLPLEVTEGRDSLWIEFDVSTGGDYLHSVSVFFTPDSVKYMPSTDYKKGWVALRGNGKNGTHPSVRFQKGNYEWNTYCQGSNPKVYHIAQAIKNPTPKAGEYINLYIAWKQDNYTNMQCKSAPRISNLHVHEIQPPAFTVTTDSAAMISDKSATLYATMDVDAQYTLAAKGFEYKASAATDYTKVDVNGDNFVYTLNGLVPETEYTFRAFIAKNITDTTFDTVYGAELTFTTLEEQIVIVDPTVQTATPNAVWTDAATLVANVTPGTKDINEYGFEYRLASAGDDTYQSKIGTVNNTTITATITGLEVNTMYTVRGYVKTEDGTFYGNVITFSTNDTTIIYDTSSIAELSNNVTISMYPNPTSDNAVLTINGLNGAAKVILTDVQGRIIEESEIALGEDTMTINTASLESGVYYVRIVANGILRTEKLIKK